MDVREYFNRVQSAIYSRRDLQKLLPDLDDQMTATGGFTYNPDKVQTSVTNGKEEKLCNLIDMKRGYEERIAKYTAIILEAEDRLHEMSKAEYAYILRKLYFEDRRLTYFEIGQMMGYTETYTKQLANDAFEEFTRRWLA